MQFVSMTAKQFREIASGKKPSKYHAQKTVVDGITFDSKKESKKWKELCTMEATGIISNLQRQVQFELQPAYVNNQGKKIRAINYIADFVFEQDNKIYVMDSKGMRTKDYILKRKIFEYKYPGYIFIES